MMKKTQTKPEQQTLAIGKPENGIGRLKRIGGSRDDNFNNVLANQVVNALWLDRTDDGSREKQKTGRHFGANGHRPERRDRGHAGSADGRDPLRLAGMPATCDDSRADLSGTDGSAQPGEQAVAYLHDADGGATALSRQRAAEGNRRACPRAFGRAGDCRHGYRGNRGSLRNRETTRCKANYLCTRARVAEPGRAAASRAGRPP